MTIISLCQPFASLMVEAYVNDKGEKAPWAIKPIETRGWSASFRGRLGIHASKTATKEWRDVFYTEPFRTLCRAMGFKEWSEMPFGALVGSVNMIGCDGFPITPREITRPPFMKIPWPPPTNTLWGALGDFSPGRYGYLCCDPKRYERPLPAIGAQKFFRFKDSDIRDAMGGIKTTPLRPYKGGDDEGRFR